MPRIERLLPLLLLAAGLPVQAAAPTALPGLQPPSIAAEPMSAQASWSALTTAQKREARSRYAAWQALSEAERQRLRQAAAALAALPPAQRQAVQAGFAGMDQLHRDGWLLGPQLGMFYPRLQPLFGFLPEAERAPVLALLRALDPLQLEQLSRVAQRTPPQERGALRAELLALAPAQRAAWLQQKAGR